MNCAVAQVAWRRDLGNQYTHLALKGCFFLQNSQPGQFVMLRPKQWARDPLLGRAYSILWVQNDEAEFLIHRCGRGSQLIAELVPGAQIEVVGPLGNYFPPIDGEHHFLLVAGGCGVPPLGMAARRAAQNGFAENFKIYFGARQKNGVILVDQLVSQGIDVNIATEDGSLGHKGLVTDLLPTTESLRGKNVRVYACGPLEMLRAIKHLASERDWSCFLSLESAMACGHGACLGCATQAAAGGFLYVCQEGPIFEADKVKL